LSPGAQAVFVEEGTVALSQESTQPGFATTLVAGDVAALPGSAGFSLRHQRGAAASVLVLVAPLSVTYTGPLQPDRADATPVAARPASPDEITVEQRLAVDLAISFPTGAVSLQIGRMSLPPGTSIAMDGAAGPVLIVAASGSLAVESGAGLVLLSRPANGAGGSAATLVPPERGTALHVIGDEPGVVLIGAVLPESTPELDQP
jgi:hypothetical protein